jgi:uncharacterized protein YdaT
MPWTVADVDSKKKGLTPAQKTKWVAIANGILADCKKKGGKDCEASAIKIANSKFSFVDLTSSWTVDDLEHHDDFFCITANEREAFATDDRKKPGGSNEGKYKSGPFCGPSGGAPKGTYPVNTRARAIAAIAYARNAPNPAGIKGSVCRYYPDLAACGKKKD